ncbi:MAG: DUF6584 family protein [Chloroflexota bacterium]
MKGLFLVSEEKLKQVDHYLAAGQLTDARDQLHKLLDAYPNKLDVRQKLGEVYWKLENPVMAGRYWFLIEATTPEMVAATYEFANMCHNDPMEIFNHLEFNGDIAELNSDFAKFMLINLDKEITIRYDTSFAQIQQEKQEELETFILPLNYEKKNPVKRAFYWAGCITALAVPVAVVVGITVVSVRWIVDFF